MAARTYLDPWDLENSAYIRTRRRSVAFHHAVHFSDDVYGPLIVDEPVYEEPPYCPYHHPPQYRDYQELKESWRGRVGVNPLGHLRIDYSNNWAKLDRFIGHRWRPHQALCIPIHQQ